MSDSKYRCLYGADNNNRDGKALWKRLMTLLTSLNYMSKIATYKYSHVQLTMCILSSKFESDNPNSPGETV